MDNRPPIETKNYRPPKKSKKPLVVGLACFVAGTVFGAAATSIVGTSSNNLTDQIATKVIINEANGSFGYIVEANGSFGYIHWNSDIVATMVPSYTKPSDHEHVFVKYNTIEYPSCNSYGTAIAYCDYCNEEMRMILPATGHTEVAIPGYPATSWDDGLTDGIYCENCGEMLKEQEIIPAGTPSYENEFEYKILTNDTCEITRLVNCTSDYLVVPDYIDGYRVTSIGAFAFEGWAVTDIVIPEGVTNIETDAFNGCYYLRYISLPESVTSIGSKAFANCHSLETINIPSFVKAIRSETFIDCSALQVVKMGGHIQIIENGAFYGCSSLVEIGYYDGTIDDWYRIEKEDYWDYGTGEYVVFCTDGMVSKSSPSVGLDYYFSEQGCIINGIGSCTDTHIRIPSVIDGMDVIAIEKCAFQDCYDITEVTIGYGVTDLYEYAFKNTAISRITIPTSVTRIRQGVFDGCGALTEIIYEGTVSEWEAINKASGWIMGANDGCVVYCTDGIGSKNPSTFRYEAYGDGTCSITGYFKNNTVVNIPGSIDDYRVTTIASDAFRDNTYIKTLTISNGVEVIGDYTFYGCTSLTSVDIPNSVTNIGGWAFGDCTSLSTINYEGTVEEWHNIQKDSDWSLLGYSCTVYCTDGNVTYGSDESEKMFDYVLETDSTCKITSYNGYDSYIVIPEYIDGYRVTAIGEKAFASNNNIISVTIPSTVTEIHSYAFLNCNGLENVIIPDSVTKIDTGAFQNCGSLVTINVPASVTSIGNDAFDAPCLLAINVETGNNYYTSIDGVLLSADGKTLICYPCGKTPFEIPNGVEAIGLNAFKGCNNGVHTIVIPEGVTTIDSRAFNNLNLTDVTLPASVIIIGDYAFAGNTNLSKITYSGTVAEWAAVMKGAGWHSNTGNYTVYCTDGTIAKDGTVTYNPADDPSVEALYEYIVSGNGTCEINQYYGNEANVVIPEYLGGYKVVSIAKGAFYANTSIMSVTIPNGVTSIGEQAFAYCTSLTEVVIPESVETIYSDAFDGCDNLKSVYYNSTISEWQTVYLGNYGESTWNATVYCTDGSIAADGTVTYN